MSFKNNIEQEKCGFYFYVLNCKNCGTTDVYKCYKGASKVWAMDLES